MAEFTAKDVQALRQATGAGMMDAKKALMENDGDMEAAMKWLREKGLAKAGDRADRENSQGAVAIGQVADAVAIVELKTETDFTAKSDAVVATVQRLADAVAADGEGAVDAQKDVIDDLKVTTKENIDVGRVVRIEVGAGDVVDTHLHSQDGRGVNAVVIVLSGGSAELAHDIAVHLAFTKAPYVRRDEVPDEIVATERDTLEAITRAEGKPEQAIEKIVEGRLNAWFKDRVLLEQGFVRDDKTTIAQLLGDATLGRVAQVFIGG